MNGMLLKYQMMVFGALSVIMLSEWGFNEFSQSRLQDTLNKTITTDYQAEPLPSLNLPKQTADSFVDIIERPLFIEGRKPLPEVVPENVEQGVDSSQLDDWLLIGIYNNKDTKDVALFRKQNEAKKFLKLNVQQTISGWQLKEIKSDRVVLELGGQQKTVMLRKPRQQPKAPLPQKRPVPPPVAPTIPSASPNNNNPSENNDNDG